MTGNKAQTYLLKCIVLFGTMYLHLGLNAQLSLYPQSFTVRSSYGAILAHKKDMDHLVTGHIPSFELSYRYNSYGSKEWEKFYRFPSTGVALAYHDFNNSILGASISLYPYISFPLRRSKFTELHFRGGLGLGAITQKFDLESNRKNTIMSSTLNGAASALLQFRVKLFPGCFMDWGIGFFHLSNGAYKIPNAGVNVFDASVGLTIPVGKQVGVNHLSFPIVPRGWRFLAWTGGFLKEVNPVNRRKLLAFTLSGNALRRISNKVSYGGGIDFSYDATLATRNRQIREKGGFPVRVGIAAAFELHAGKLTFPIQFGMYAIDTYKWDTMWYQRFGIRRHISKNLFAQITLKTHFAKADYTEFGVGYFIK